MSADAVIILQVLFNTIWQLFTGWHIPGTNITPAAALIFLVFAPLILKFIAHLFGMGGIFGGSVSRSSARISAATRSFGSGHSGGGGK